MEQKTLDLSNEPDPSEIEISEIIHEKVEYFRKPGRIIPDQILRDEAGQKILITSEGKRSRGRLKGVMVAYVQEGNDVVNIGFSMCHPSDKWDCIKGVCNPGLGKQIASDRAEKWVIKNQCITYKDLKAQKLSAALKGAELATNDIKKFVVVPDSMHESLETFIRRCKDYYKDKRFPVWVDNLPTASSPE